MNRVLIALAALVVPALACAQDGGSGGGDNTLLLVGIAVLALVGVIVAALLMRQKAGGASKGGNRPATADGDDEATQVRTSGHRLVRVHGGVKVGAEFPIAGFITVGRGSACTITLSDQEMSTRHAEFSADGRGAYVTDSASTNGTFVNDVKITPDMPTSLKDGDLIRMGNTTLLYKSGA